VSQTEQRLDPRGPFEARFSRYSVYEPPFYPTVSLQVFEVLPQPTTNLVLLDSPVSLSFESTNVDKTPRFPNGMALRFLLKTLGVRPCSNRLSMGMTLAPTLLTKYVYEHSDVLLSVTIAQDDATC
jgi:cystathionine beta-lyase/cystathionine gamma-synthase